MNRRPVLSRLTLILLDRRRRLDYLVLMVIGALPSVFAMLAGVHRSVEANGLVYLGWFDKHNNWPYVFILPIAVWIMRRAFSRIADITTAQVPTPPPPVVPLFRQAPSPQFVYELLRDWLSSPKVMGIALGIAAFIQVADTTELVRVYLFDAPVRPSELDWSVMYQAGTISKTTNALFCLAAYTMQFVLVVIAIWAICFMSAHNLFFLSKIYQRSRVPKGEEGSYITLDLDDVNLCFGFRPANDAFNTQVVGLGIAGFFILFSRFANVAVVDSSVGLTDLVSWSAIAELQLFPDVGQFLLALGWFLTLWIVSSPALVKLLPRLPGRQARSQLSIDGYLKEFLTDAQWRYGDHPSEKQINLMAAKFARNAFWPTGDNRASQLFFFSFWVFLVILYPLRTTSLPLLLVSLLVLGAIAYGMRSILFWFLNGSLAYVDERLTQPRPELLKEEDDKKVAITSNVFLSYRREDSLAYSRLLKQTLSGYMENAKVFMDLTDIKGGEDFVARLDASIKDCESVIVVIGPAWAQCRDADGNRRLDKADDFVRLEIATALAENKRIVPVLVGSAKMPVADELPIDIKPLWRRNAMELSDSRWEYDVNQLANALKDDAR